jgi:hypothetical protein
MRTRKKEREGILATPTLTSRIHSKTTKVKSKATIHSFSDNNKIFERSASSLPPPSPSFQTLTRRQNLQQVDQNAPLNFPLLSMLYSRAQFNPTSTLTPFLASPLPFANNGTEQQFLQLLQQQLVSLQQQQQQQQQQQIIFPCLTDIMKQENLSSKALTTHSEIEIDTLLASPSLAELPSVDTVLKYVTEAGSQSEKEPKQFSIDKLIN